MKEFIIGKNDAGQRLDRFTAKTVPLLSTGLMQKYIRLKRIKVGNKGSKGNYILAIGDVVSMYLNDEYFESPDTGKEFLKVSSNSLDIVYEDKNLILANKEAGVLCHSDGSYDYNSLIARIQAYLYQKREWLPNDENSFSPALCNRIDRNTSGIVIAAKNAETLRIINEKIKLREIDKYYLAAVHGKPDPASGEVKGYLFKDAVKNQVYVTKESRPGAKPAVTAYKTLNTKGELSLHECRLITGRTHQIGAQLADIGYPLLGDGKYGREKFNKPYGESRQALCSYKLVFAFKSDAGILNYVNGKEFKLSQIPFVDKYFPSSGF